MTKEEKYDTKLVKLDSETLAGLILGMNCLLVNSLSLKDGESVVSFGMYSRAQGMIDVLFAIFGENIINAVAEQFSPVDMMKALKVHNYKALAEIILHDIENHKKMQEGVRPGLSADTVNSMVAEAVSMLKKKSE